MDEFEMTVTLLNHKQVEASVPNNDPVSGELQYGSLRRDTILIFENWLRNKRMKRSEEFQLLGRLLYDTLFNGNVEKVFEDQLLAARKARKRLIVRLSFREEASDLTELPWEYLYYKKDEDFFLSTFVNLVLSRSTGGFLELQPEKGPLRLLIVISSPGGDGLVPVTEADQVTQAIRDVGGNTVKIDILTTPTVDNFLTELKAEPHLLHFIGHGRLKDKKEAEIAFLGEDLKNVRWIRGNEFADYFRQMQAIPRLVLLHLSENSKTINSDTSIASFAHLGRELMRVNIPAVLAMQYPIPSKAAVVFSTVFYQELFKGKSIDEAVQEGRWRMATRIYEEGFDTGMFGMPMLYVRSRGGIILPESASPTPQSLQETTRIEQSSLQIPINTFNRPVQTDIVPRDELKPETVAPKAEQITYDENSLPNAVILIGRETLKEIKLPFPQKIRLRERLSFISQVLAGKRIDDILDILFEQKDHCADDDPFRSVIQSMIVSLEEMP